MKQRSGLTPKPITAERAVRGERSLRRSTLHACIPGKARAYNINVTALTQAAIDAAGAASEAYQPCVIIHLVDRRRGASRGALMRPDDAVRFFENGLALARELQARAPAPPTDQKTAAETNPDPRRLAS